MCSAKTLDSINRSVVNGAMKFSNDSLYKVFLYGSYARKDYDNESDIDYMVVADGSPLDMKKLHHEMLEVSERLSFDNDMVVSVLVRDKANFETQKNVLPLYRNILREGVVLYG